MAFATAGGMSSMLKDGAKQMSGLEEAVLKNVGAISFDTIDLCHAVRPSSRVCEHCGFGVGRSRRASSSP